MNIAIVGPGNIGGNLARLWAQAGHKLYFTFSHDQKKLERLAEQAGNDSKAMTPYDAVLCADVVLFSPPWREMDKALKQIGEFKDKVVIDTTNPYVDDQMNVKIFDEQDSSSETVAKKMRDAKVIKAFNTLHAQTLLDRSGQGVVIFMAGDYPVAMKTVEKLVEDAGFVPYDVGPLHEGKKQEPGTERYLKELSRAQADQLTGAAGGTSNVTTGVVEGYERADQGSVPG